MTTSFTNPQREQQVTVEIYQVSPMSRTHQDSISSLCEIFVNVDADSDKMSDTARESHSSSDIQTMAAQVNVFSQSFMSPIVRVTIRGWPHPPRQPFQLHRNALTETSEYFRGCLQSGLKESQNSEVDLDLDEGYRTAFGHYVEFVYTGSYSASEEVTISHPVPFNEDEAHELGTRCSRQVLLHTWVYLLGEQILSNGLRKLALEKLRTTLLVAYLYPHPSGAGRFVYPASWGYWNDITDYKSYREYCHGMDTQNLEGTRIPSTTLIGRDELTRVIQLVYENTPHSPVENDGIRTVLARYCASCFEDLRMTADFMDLVHGNRELFDDLMGFVQSGKSLRI